MSRLSIPTLDAAPEASKPVLAAVNQQLGVVPNLFRVVAHSPNALQGFAANNAQLGKTLDVKTRERIAIAVAEINGCDYCLSAHSYLATNLAKLSADEVTLNRRGESSDAKANAAVRFAATVARERGHVSQADVQVVRDAGYSEAEVVEIVAVIAENFFTNFINIVADTEIDFPVVRTNAANLIKKAA